MIAENDAQRAETSSDAEEHNKISKEDLLDGGFSLFGQVFDETNRLNI